MLTPITVLPENKMYPLPLSMSLDINFDYISQEERDKALLYLDEFIKKHNIQPLPVGKFTKIPESCLLYTPALNEVDYADMYDFLQ